MHGAEREDRRLRQIVTLLLSFAALAEKAGRRSFPLRWFVLALLRHAEAVARDFVAETIGAAPLFLEVPVESGSEPADAVHLAGRLRALAALLCTILPSDSRKDPRARTGSDPRRVAGHRLAASTGGFTRPVFDTS